MQVKITFRHLDSSESTKEYAKEKINKITKYLEEPIETNIILSAEKHKYEVDIILFASGIKIHGKDSAVDLFSAINLVTDKLERQIKRYKDKLRNVNRNQRKSGNKPFKVEILQTENFTNNEPKIIKTHKLTAQTMDISEAAMQLDLSQNDFLVFINSKTKTINVIYRRDDEKMGLIEPQ